MNDPELETLLGGYRPVGPPARLRQRILPVRSRRTWPWLGAAAALLLTTVLLHIAARHESARVDLGPDPIAAVVDDLTERMGGDAAARQRAERIVLEQRLREETAAITPTGEPR